MADHMTYLGIEAGDWLQAGANFLGVGVTIMGTLFIERRLRHADKHEDAMRIIEVVQSLTDSSGEIRAGMPDDATQFNHYSRSLSMQTALKSSLDMYRFVRADTKVTNLNLWRALKALDEVLARRGPTIESELRIFQTDGNYTAVFDINRSKVMEASVPISVAASDVLAVKL
jgi:hypothetical protein